MEKWIDLRSDTVTQPTEAMKKTMIEAPLGDDVYGDDPTVNELEYYSAQMLGKEGALFVPSGSFGNQLALLTHTRRGDEVILAEDAHIIAHEVGASAVIAGVQLKTFALKNGNRLPVDKIKKLLREDDIHYPKTGLVCLENALSNGMVVPLEDMKELKKWACEQNIPIHLDGARLFNATHALGVEGKEIAAQVDSVNVCLSKGLCAPVGSILVGDETFIKKARKNRKLMGGGMRQAGVIAAPALYALKNMVDRLDKDHKNAKYMAQKLDELPGFSVFENRLDINMIFFTVDEKYITESVLINGLLEEQIKANGMENGEYRFVVHKDISKSDIDKTLEVLKRLVKI